MSRPRSVRPSLKEQFWRTHFDRWQSSGLSVRRYCQLHQLSEPTFYHWRRTLAQRERTTPTASPVTFVPVQLPEKPPPVSTAALELLLDQGRVLRIPLACPADTLRLVLRLVQEDPC
jgi:transposase-like protein